jgi:hypothetical protein
MNGLWNMLRRAGLMYYEPDLRNTLPCLVITALSRFHTSTEDKLSDIMKTDLSYSYDILWWIFIGRHLYLPLLWKVSKSNFFSLTRRIIGYYLEIGHDRLLPNHHTQRSIAFPPYLTQYNICSWNSVVNQHLANLVMITEMVSISRLSGLRTLSTTFPLNKP